MPNRFFSKFDSKTNKFVLSALIAFASIAIWTLQLHNSNTDDTNTAKITEFAQNSETSTEPSLEQANDRAQASFPVAATSKPKRPQAEQQIIEPTWTIQRTIDESLTKIEDSPPLILRKRIVEIEEIDVPIIIEDILIPDQEKTNPQYLSAYIANRLLIKTTDDVTSFLENTGIDSNWKFVRLIGKSGYALIETTNFHLASLDQAKATFTQSKNLIHAEKDFIYYATDTAPNDADFANNLQWGLRNPTNNGFDINAPTGWDLRTDASSTIIAVIDSGINLDHQDLKPNLWRNENEIPGNEIDDDNNGYIDDTFGINLLDGGDPLDESGHGSHVAGIIGAKGNNGLGTVGVTWNTQLMALKFLNKNGFGALSDAVESIDYATLMGANIINASWGGTDESALLFEAIIRSRDAGILFVAASGNDNNNLNYSNIYPASYDVSNILAVSAINQDGDIAEFSNFGTRTVDIAAPGTEILSTWIGSEDAYSTNSGTSMAAPFVSGIFALLHSQYPDDDPNVQIARLLASGKHVSKLEDQIRTGKIPDLAAALALSVVPFPPLLSSNTASITYAEIGDQVTFEMVDANQSFTDTNYQWFLDGNLLAQENSLTLELEASTQSAGIYKIIATNEHGTDQFEFELRVFVPQPDLAAALDYSEGQFFAYTGSDWSIYQDAKSVGGTAIRRKVFQQQPQDTLRLTVDGPGELRMKYRRTSTKSNHSEHFEVKYDDEQERYYNEDQWTKTTLFIQGDGSQTISWKVDNVFSRNLGPDDEIFLDSIVFFSSSSLPPNITSYNGFSSFREASTLSLRLNVNHNVDQYQWLKNGSPFAVTEYPILIIENVSIEDAGTYQLIASNEFGSDNSEQIDVEITAGPPRFPNDNNEPISEQLNEGDSLTLAPEYTGSFELAFQWYKNNIEIQGANRPTLSFNPVTPFDHGRYHLEIWYPSTGERTEGPDYYLAIQPARSKPTIYLDQNEINVIEEGSPLTIYTDTEGSTPISHQWYHNNVPIPGATDEYLIQETTTLSDAGSYYLIAQNDYGLTRSVDMDITVASEPNLNELLDAPFTWNPINAEIALPEYSSEFEGGSALRFDYRDPTFNTSYSLSFTTTGTGLFRFRLYSAAPVTSTSYARDKLTVAIGNTGSQSWYLQEGWLDVELPVFEGQNEIEIIVRREDAEYFILDAFALDSTPTIIEGPMDATTEIGKSSKFSIVVTGPSEIQYQWYKNGISIPGANNSEYTIPVTSLSDEGSYHATASNGNDVATSTVATLSTVQDLAGYLNLDDVSISSGGDAAWNLLANSATLSSGAHSSQFLNWVKFDINGPTFFNFESKGSGADVILDDDHYDRLNSYSDAWKTVSIPITQGAHTVEIEYYSALGSPDPFLIRNIRTDTHPEFAVSPSDKIVLSEYAQRTLSAAVPDAIPRDFPYPITFQWYKDGSPVSQDAFTSKPSGYTSIDIGTNDLPAPGVYYCEATFPNGSKTNSASATVTLFEGALDAITEHTNTFLIETEYNVTLAIDTETYRTGGSSLRVDDNTTLTLVAPSSGTISFWAKTVGLNAANTFEPGTTTNPYTSISESHDWKRYEFTVGDIEDFDLNLNIRARFSTDDTTHLWIDDLRFSTGPTFTKHPNSVQVQPGESVVLKTEVHTSSPATYQWSKDGVPIDGATESTLEIETVSNDSFGTYNLTAYQEAGSTISKPAIISLRSPINLAIDAPLLSIQNGGNKLWTVETDEWLYNSSSILSPALEFGETSYIQFQVVGPVDIGFYTKAYQAGNSNGTSSIFIDDVPVPNGFFITYRRWSFHSIPVTKEGLTTIRIELTNTRERDQEEMESHRTYLDRLQLRYPGYKGYNNWIEEKTSEEVDLSSNDQSPLDDSNSDGIANFWEFIFSSKASLFDGTPIKLKTDDQNDYFSIQATLRLDYDYSVLLEYSDDLKKWNAIEPTPVPNSGSSEIVTQTLEWRIYSPTSSSLFLRWKTYGLEETVSF